MHLGCACCTFAVRQRVCAASIRDTLQSASLRYIAPVRRRMFLGGPAAYAYNMEHRSTVLDRRGDRGTTEVRLDGLSFIVGSSFARVLNVFSSQSLSTLLKI